MEDQELNALEKERDIYRSLEVKEEIRSEVEAMRKKWDHKVPQGLAQQLENLHKVAEHYGFKVEKRN